MPSQRENYSRLRDAGFSVDSAEELVTRSQYQIDEFIDKFDDIVETLYQDWNKRYLNGEDFEEITREDIRERVESGIESGKSIEEIENY